MSPTLSICAACLRDGVVLLERLCFDSRNCSQKSLPMLILVKRHQKIYFQFLRHLTFFIKLMQILCFKYFVSFVLFFCFCRKHFLFYMYIFFCQFCTISMVFIRLGQYGGSPSGKNDTSLLTTDFDFVGDELETFPTREERTYLDGAGKSFLN